MPNALDVSADGWTVTVHGCRSVLLLTAPGVPPTPLLTANATAEWFPGDVTTTPTGDVVFEAGTLLYVDRAT
ncbi:MAG: hypothetical protein ACRD29_14590 [Acidimicrobiales bacterium]